MLDRLKALLKYRRKVVNIIALLILISTVIHHFLICGRLFDINDFLHHESIMAAAIFFIAGSYVKDIIEAVIKVISNLRQ